MNQTVQKTILQFMREQNGISESDGEFWRYQREFLSRVGNGRGIAFTARDQSMYVIQHVVEDCYVVMPANSEVKIHIPLTRQLQERIDATLEEANRIPVILICYDINSAKLRDDVEKKVRAPLQERLKGVARITTELSDDELSVQPGEAPQLLAERQVNAVTGVILCITSGYVSSARYPHQLELFRLLGGKVFPVMYQSGLSLPPLLSMLEHDDGFDFGRLEATIRRWVKR